MRTRAWTNAGPRAQEQNDPLGPFVQVRGRYACGGCRIRTFVAFATDLQSAPIGRSGNPPGALRRGSKDNGTPGGQRKRVASGSTCSRAPDGHDGSDPHGRHSSFDIVSKVDRQEVDNALNQAAKELSQRFDFRGTDAAITWAGRRGRQHQGRHRGPGQGRPRGLQGEAGQAADLAEVARRRRAAPRPARIYKIDCKIVQGIDSDKAKEISKKIRDERPEGRPGPDPGRPAAGLRKKKDDLQTVIALLKGRDFGIALQFVNYR